MTCQQCANPSLKGVHTCNTLGLHVGEWTSRAAIAHCERLMALPRMGFTPEAPRDAFFRVLNMGASE